MESQRTLLVSVALIVAAALLTSAVLLSLDRDAEPSSAAVSEEDIIGHWYIVGGQGCTDGGRFVDYRSNTFAQVGSNLDVYFEKYGLFYGYYMGQPVTGTCEEGVVEMSITLDLTAQGRGVTTAWMHGYLPNAGTLVISAITFTENGANAMASGALMIMSKEVTATAAVFPEASVDLSGAWVISSGYNYTEQAATPIGFGGTVTVVQQGSAFCGASDIDRPDGTTHSLPFAGALCYDRATGEGQIIGAYYTQGGAYWSFEMIDGSVVAWSFSDVDGQIVCQMLKFVRPGVTAPGLPAADTGGRGYWHCTGISTMQGTDVVRSVEMFDVYKTVEYGSLSLGYVETGDGQHHPRAAYLRTGPLLREEFFTIMGERSYTSFCASHDGKIVEATFAGGTAQRLTFEMNKSSYDLTGYWRDSISRGYLQDGTYVVRDGDASIDEAYAVTIYRIEGNAFYGSYMGQYISGTVTGNSFTFSVEASDGLNIVSCTAINSQTLQLWCLVRNTATGQYSAWSDLMTRQYCDVGVIPQLSDYDFSGQWQMLDGGGCSYTGAISVPLSGRILDITEIRGNVFKGTMEQRVGSAAVQKVVCGTVTGQDEQYVEARVIDSTGLMWRMYIDRQADQLTMLATTVSEVTEIKGQPVTIERTYTRDGTGTMPEAGWQLAGSVWRMTAGEIMSDRGEYSVYDKEVTLTVERQTGILLSGTIIDDGYVVKFVGFAYGGRVAIITDISTDASDLSTFVISGSQCYETAYHHNLVTRDYEAKVSWYDITWGKA